MGKRLSCRVWGGRMLVAGAVALGGDVVRADEPNPLPWTLHPMRVDPTKERRERLPPRFADGDTVPRQTLRVDPFPGLEADGSFSARGARWRIAHVVLPPRDLACTTGDGRIWRCGVRAWAYFSSLLAGRRLRCTPPEGEVSGAPALDCRLDGVSVAELVVATGWLRPAADAPRDLVALGRAAAEAARGLHATTIPP